jgi:hypothetical protein
VLGGTLPSACKISSMESRMEPNMEAMLEDREGCIVHAGSIRSNGMQIDAEAAADAWKAVPACRRVVRNGLEYFAGQRIQSDKQVGSL